MGFDRRFVGVLTSTAVVLAVVAVAAPAGAGSLDACAQRVIRDWYSGGRVDGVYPLACYRAAIRALPSDVLQYSDADQDIRRALAFARRGRPDPGDGPAAATVAPPSAATPPAPPVETAPAKEPEPAPSPRPATPPQPAANDVAIAPRKASVVPEAPPVSASVPYPVIALAGLAGVLLATGAAGWLASRRHGQGDGPDR
jgi:hypothetical protein